MSAASAAALLRRKADGLNAIASGASASSAAARIRAELVALLEPIVGEHVRSGNALSTLEVAVDGATVSVKSAGYLKFHPWWPLRNGMPAELKQRALEIFREETMKLLAAR